MPSVDDQYAQTDYQVDFSGGENSVADKVLVRSNQSTKLQNLFPKRGGGLETRKGYKAVNVATGQGRWVREFDITIGQILSYVDVGANWYEDTNSPRYDVFFTTPQVNDAWYFGGTLTKFNQLLANFIWATVAGNVFVWEVSGGSGTWIDKTASVTESVANGKQLRVTGEVLYSWPDLTDWLPQQVETRNYGYWWRVRCTVGGAASNGVTIGQKRLRSDWLGQRKLMMASTTVMHELPGLTLTARSVEAYQRIDRMNGVVLNDHLYYHSDGQRPLKRWNFARGIRRDGNTNNPVDAGNTKPTTNVALTSTPVAAGYADNSVLSYCCSYVEGPEGILGEGRPSDQTAAAATVTLPGAGGPHRVNVDFTAIRDSGLAFNCHAIRIYATRNLVGKDASERTNLANYLLVKVVTRDDATWTAGVFQDNNVQRIVTGVATPIDYDSTPTIKPKYIALGGERCWIADDHFLYASAIRRGDSYDPRLSWEFPRIRNIYWWIDRMLVFGDERIWAVRGINTGLPYVEDFYLGLGLAQPDSLTVCDGALRFISHRGPAEITGTSVSLLGVGRVFESSNYWLKKVGEGRIAQGAYFEDRWWIPVDRGSNASPVTQGPVAVYDAIERGWSYTFFKGTGGPQTGWGALAVVHGTLEHATSGQRILVGFPDGAIAGDSDDLCILEYGTTDQWATNDWDGAEVVIIWESKALTMGALHRTKSFLHAHARVKFPYSDAANTLSMLLLADIGSPNGRSISVGGNNSGGNYVDVKIELNPAGGTGGEFEENAPVLRIGASTDKGLELLSWWAKALVQEFAVDHQV